MVLQVLVVPRLGQHAPVRPVSAPHVLLELTHADGASAAASGLPPLPQPTRNTPDRPLEVPPALQVPDDEGVSHGP